MALLSATSIKSIIQSTQFKDPRLYDVLIAFADRLAALNIDVQAIQNQVTESLIETTSSTVDSVVTFDYQLFPDYVSLTWERPSDLVFNFEIRKGANWDTAVRVLVTNTLNAVVDPLPIGVTTYLIKSIDSVGLYSVTAKAVNITVPPIGTISITHQVVDNNVLLYWNVPTSSFRIIHYIIKRNGTEIGTKDGTFTTIFEQSSGANIYSIAGVDIAGNIGAYTDRSIAVSQPPDYVLADRLISTLSETPTNGKVTDEKLLVCIPDSDTWEDHFVNNSWDTIQDQIDAGYLYFIQPGETTGQYQEVFNFGTTYNDVIVTADWTVEVIDESVTINVTIELSDDGITYGTPIAANSAFAASVQFVRLTLDFSGGVHKLIQLFNLSIKLDVKQITDSGTIAVLAADVGGTVVTFNKAFKDINSIVLSVRNTVEINAIYDFVDAPDPTDFKILAYNAAGSRTNATVSWIARGIQ